MEDIEERIKQLNSNFSVVNNEIENVIKSIVNVLIGNKIKHKSFGEGIV